jgi:fructuronate reductase
LTRLSLSTLETARRARRPAYDIGRLAVGMAHLGVGAFHRAHQAVFTDDAIEAAGGDWGIVGISLRRPDAAAALGPQDGLYTLEIRTAEPTWRIVGALRRVITAPSEPDAALAALADPAVQVITLTVTEPGYALGSDGDLDFTHPDIVHDLANPRGPRSAVGWLVAGLAGRRAAGGGPVTVLSCDNLRYNGRRLDGAVRALAKRLDPELVAWIAGETAFPDTVVDAITPASDAALAARVEDAIGLEDHAAVQREPFADWIIEDRFAGRRPAWERAGARLVRDVASFEAFKLHVLNAAHSTLAYLGRPRGHLLVREAIADPELAAFLDAMIAEEVAPALSLVSTRAEVAAYWRLTRERFAQPAIDHRLEQIARDGAAKLRERIHPLIIAGGRSGRSVDRLAEVIRAWLASDGRDIERAMDDPALFAQPFRAERAVRTALTRRRPDAWR